MLSVLNDWPLFKSFTCIQIQNFGLKPFSLCNNDTQREHTYVQVSGLLDLAVRQCEGVLSLAAVVWNRLTSKKAGKNTDQMNIDSKMFNLVDG